jgi:uncharacterized protein YajQ (UPF0234 family)
MPQFSPIAALAERVRSTISPGPRVALRSTSSDSNHAQLRHRARTRFDFKGSSARVELKEKELTVWADSDFQIGQVLDILIAKLTKRSVDIRFLDRTAKIEKIGGDKVKQLIVVKNGIDSDTAKKIQNFVKQSKMKVQAAIQGDTVRVTGAKRDDLQAAMALIRKEIADAPLSFTNFRD